MDHALVVRVVERLGDLGGDLRGERGCYSAVGVEPGAQGLAVDELHREVGDGSDLPAVVDADDVRMVERPAEIRLSNEPFEEARIVACYDDDPERARKVAEACLIDRICPTLDDAYEGVDGVLIVDYPPEECEEFAAKLRAANMDAIFLLAPTSTEKRMTQVGQLASGYVYYVSLKGVTGAGHLNTAAVAEAVPRIRRHVSTPVGVGFGIRDGATARAVADVSDAVVIGSKLVELLERQPADNVASTGAAFIREIRAALDKKD